MSDRTVIVYISAYKKHDCAVMHTVKADINRKKYPVSFFSLNCGTTGYLTGAYLLFEFIPYYLLWSE